MIARRWHGRVRAEQSDAYLALTEQHGLVDYRATPGNRGAWCFRRREGDIVHFETLSYWEDETAIRRFAGEDIRVARYYDFDDAYLLEKEPEVLHFEVYG